jgi:hypothetical protein
LQNLAREVKGRPFEGDPDCPKDLVASVCGLGRGAASRVVGRACLEGQAGLSSFVKIRSRPRNQPRSFDSDVTIREGVGDGLKLSDRLTELFARRGVGRGGADQRIPGANEVGRERDAVERQRFGRISEVFDSLTVNPPEDLSAKGIDAFDDTDGAHSVDVFAIDLEENCGDGS